MRILVLNGPNLNRLGKREPEIYGTTTLADLESTLADAFPNVRFQFSQSNHEGELINSLHAAGDEGLDGVVINPAGLSHTSVALRDAIASIDVPVIEVHISNIHAREPFRHQSLTAGASSGVITGLGLRGYHLAVQYLLDTSS
jgi:3-dehydroquinate dehydratase II